MVEIALKLWQSFIIGRLINYPKRNKMTSKNCRRKVSMPVCRNLRTLLRARQMMMFCPCPIAMATTIWTVSPPCKSLLSLKQRKIKRFSPLLMGRFIWRVMMSLLPLVKRSVQSLCVCMAFTQVAWLRGKESLRVIELVRPRLTQVLKCPMRNMTQTKRN